MASDDGHVQAKPQSYDSDRRPSSTWQGLGIRSCVGNIIPFSNPSGHYPLVALSCSRVGQGHGAMAKPVRLSSHADLAAQRCRSMHACAIQHQTSSPLASSASWGRSAIALIGEMPGAPSKGAGRSLNAITQPSLAFLDKTPEQFDERIPSLLLQAQHTCKRPTMWSHSFLLSLVQPQNSSFWASPHRCGYLCKPHPRGSLSQSDSLFSSLFL